MAVVLMAGGAMLGALMGVLAWVAFGVPVLWCLAIYLGTTFGVTLLTMAALALRPIKPRTQYPPAFPQFANSGGVSAP